MDRQMGVSGRRYRFVNVAEAAERYGKTVTSLPYVYRVLLENLCRSQAWGRPVEEADIARLLMGDKKSLVDLPLYVSRVILPDSSGLPVLQDLAALREAVLTKGGNGEQVDAIVPVDLIVDHSLQVDYWARPDAVSLNLARETSRNEERYKFLKWAQGTFKKLRLYPPGTGIIHQINLEKIATVVNVDNWGGNFGRILILLLAVIHIPL